MPVPVNKKLKGARGVKKENATLSRFKKVSGGKTKPTAMLTQAKREPKKKVGNVDKKLIKSEDIKIKSEEAPYTQKYDRATGGSSPESKAALNVRKFSTSHEYKTPKIVKIHPEVRKLVKLMKRSISLIDSSHGDLENIKKENIEENSFCEPLAGDDCDSCGNPNCSCCTEYSDNSETNNFSSDDDDEISNSSYTTSNADEETSDDNDASDADSEEDSCNSCDTCMPSHTTKNTLTGHRNNPTLMQNAKQLQKKPLKNTNNAKPKQKQSTKMMVNKKSKVAVNSKTKATNSNKKGCLNQAKPLKKTITKSKTTESKSTTSKIRADQPIKNVCPSKAGPLRKIRPLNEITNVSPTKPAYSLAKQNQKIIIKHPCHAMMQTGTTNLAPIKSTQFASTSSGYNTWSSKLCTKKSNTQRCDSPCTDYKINHKPAARRSVGVSCDLPNANSTFHNNWCERQKRCHF